MGTGEGLAKAQAALTSGNIFDGCNSIRVIANAGNFLPSFRDGPKDQTRNLEIPGSMLRIAPE
ncbi:MAG: hypothetical protein WDN50_20520 [Bradyrhizobium sp.]